MKKLKILLTLLLLAVGVNSAWAGTPQRGRVLTADEIKQGGVEIVLYLPYAASTPHDRYFQSNDAGNAFITLNGTGNTVWPTLSEKCVFVVEKVEGVEDGVKLRHKATGKYVGNSGDKPAPVEATNAEVLIVSSVGNASFDANFGYTGCEYNGSHAIRLKRNGTGNYMNSNGPQWFSGTGCWSAYVPFEAVTPSILAENYVYTVQPSTDLTKYLSTTTEVADDGFATYCWSTTKDQFVLSGSTDAWKLKSTLTDKYVGTGNGHGGVAWGCLNNPTTTWAFTEVEGQEDVFKLQANGNTYPGYLGWKTHNGQEGVVFTNTTLNNTWKFTRVGAYVTIKYMEGTTELGTYQAGVDFGQTIEAVAAAGVPEGYYLTPGQTYAQINNGCEFEYSLNVLPLPACYTLTFVDENGVALTAPVKPEVSSGVSVVKNGVYKVSVDAELTRFIGTQDYLVREFVAAIANGIEYPSWAELKEAVTGNADVTVKLATKVQVGKFYAFRHAGNTSNFYTGNTSSYHMYDTGEVLNATHYNKADDKFVFTFEDAGNGRFYIRNVGTGRYVKRTGASGIINDQNIPTLASLDADNCRYYVTNANTNVSGRTDIYGMVDADAVANPITGGSNQRFLHTNGQNGVNNSTSNKVVRWSIVDGFNSQWYIEDVPIITLKFKIAGVEYEDGIAYTAPKSGSAVLPYGQVLSTFTGISFDNYVVEEYELNGYAYTNRTQFFQECHKLTADGTATITLREKRAGEVDVTVQLWKEKGKGYLNEDMSDANPKQGNGWTDNLKVWALTVGDNDVDIKGSQIPTDVDFKIVSSEATGVGGMISATGGNHDHYHYGHVITNPWCICFQDVSAAHTGTTFTMSVASHDTDPDHNYYILQYTLGGFPGTVANLPTLTNLNGGVVHLGSPDSGARQYNLTDTPAAHEAEFTVTSPAVNTVAANYFRVRIVNETYLLNSMDRGLMIVDDALYDSEDVQAVGYPVAESTEYRELKYARDIFDGDRTLESYFDMLQAYSRYISCLNLNMPADCNVYTLSFIKSNGKQVLLNNGEEGLEIVPYTEENRAKLSARWISHTKPGYNNQNQPVTKLILVNKKDGKYLHLTDTSVGLSETYDAAYTSFNVRPTYQDMSDYMASATDEKLLGAVCIKNSAENSKLTITNVNEEEALVIKDAAYFDDDFSSALRIENVDGGGNTYNVIEFHPAADKKFYATYYGFYPVAKPDDAEMYYVTDKKDVNGDTYLVLKPIQAEVVRPEFGIILISDNEFLYKDDVEGQPTHLHVGEYTADVKKQIQDLLDENGENMLRGNFLEDVVPGHVVTDGDVYTLGQVNNRVGFYLYDGDYLPVGKAFYVDTTRSGIRGFLFETDGEVTRIDLNENMVGANDKVFDLSGRRVQNADKGFYIVNGKKVIK